MTEDYKTKYPIGSKWKTRGGDVAEVIYHNEKRKPPIIAIIEGDVGIAPYYTEDGRNYYGSGISDFDLIEPYAEPKRGVLYLNIYKDMVGVSQNTTREEADRNCIKNSRLACIRVEWKEGQYDD